MAPTIKRHMNVSVCMLIFCVYLTLAAEVNSVGLHDVLGHTIVQLSLTLKLLKKLLQR